MNKTTIAIIVLSVLVISYIKLQSKFEMDALDKRYAYELEQYRMKYQAKLDYMQNEYRKLEQVYISREAINSLYQEKQTKMMGDVPRLEVLTKKKPVLIENRINDSLKQFMESTYNETNNK